MRIKEGFYLKARCIQNSEIAHAPPYVREIWDWLLKEANFKDTKVCKRGQTVRSFKHIQEGLSWYAGWRKHSYSKDQCEKAMKWLRKATMIATQKTTRGLIITVLNYDKYQTAENYEIDKESDKKATVQQQYADTINNNDKECIKNDKYILQPAVADKYSHEDIKKTLEVFYKINPTLNWGNKTQRKAVAEMYDLWGIEKTLKMAEYAISIQGEKFSPTITTPYQLKLKSTELGLYWKKQETNNSSIRSL